jgi:hypothetical protein
MLQGADSFQVLTTPTSGASSAALRSSTLLPSPMQGESIMVRAPA